MWRRWWALSLLLVLAYASGTEEGSEIPRQAGGHHVLAVDEATSLHNKNDDKMVHVLQDPHQDRLKPNQPPAGLGRQVGEGALDYTLERQDPAEDVMSEIESIEAEAEAGIASATGNNDVSGAGNATSAAETQAATTQEEAATTGNTELEVCQLGLPGLANATAIVEANVGVCLADVASTNNTVVAEVVQAQAGTELRRTAMEQLKAQYAEEKDAHRALQTAREERLAASQHCKVRIANTKAEEAGKVEVHTQTTDKLQSDYETQHRDAMTAAKSLGDAQAAQERAMVEKARAEAKSVTDTAWASANLALKARKEEIQAVQEDQLSVIMAEANVNKTNIRDTVESARLAARDAVKQQREELDEEAKEARNKIMQMQLRLTTAENKHTAAIDDTNALEEKTRNYRLWADLHVTHLQGAVRDIEEKAQNAVDAVNRQKNRDQ